MPEPAPAQRGGNVISHLKVGHSGLVSPLIRPGQADVFLGLHPDSFMVHGFYLKENGRAFCNGSTGACHCSFEATSIAIELGAPVAANLVLLGFAAASGFLFCHREDVAAQLTRFGGNRQELNLKAFRAGVAAFPP